MTDEFPVFYKMKDDFAAHSEISHKAKKYVRMDGYFKVNDGHGQSFFALLKRRTHGIYHQMSRKDLGSYCAKRDFVYNGRMITDDERIHKAISPAKGKRLMIKPPNKRREKMFY